MKATYPSLLRPTATESIQMGTQILLIPKVELHLRKWQGAPIMDNFGGKPLVDFAGRPVFAELAVYELFRLSGWEARWIETYGAPAKKPRCYTDWSPTLPSDARARQLHQPIGTPHIVALLQRIAAENSCTFAGCWDVLGWQGETQIFAECKRKGKDRLRTTQPRWVAAALRAGLLPENFLLVEWDFMPEI